MRRFGLRAALPALALIPALAASALADCPEAVSVDEELGSIRLVTSYEIRELFNLPIWVGTGFVTLRMVYTTEVGLYVTSSGQRLEIECASSLQLAS